MTTVVKVANVVDVANETDSEKSHLKPPQHQLRGIYKYQLMPTRCLFDACLMPDFVRISGTPHAVGNVDTPKSRQ